MTLAKPPSPYSTPVTERQEAENAAYVWLKAILSQTAYAVNEMAQSSTAADAEKFEWYADRVRRAFAKLNEASAKV